MKKKKLLPKLPQFILAFICSLLLFSTVVLGALKITLFNQEFMIYQTHKIRYAKQIAKEINTDIQDYGRGSNIPPEALGTVITEELVQRNIDSYIRGIYTEVPFHLDGKKEVEDNVQTAAEAYAKEKGFAINETAQKGITKLKETSIEVLQRYVALSYLIVYGQRVMQFDQTLTILMILCGGIFLLLLFGTLYLVGKWIHRRLRLLAYVTGGAGLMLSVLPTLFYFSGTVERLAITSKAMYQFTTTYINAFILTFIWAGVLALVLAFIMWMASELMRRKIARSGA